MKITLTLELTPSQAIVMRKWASVSRTMNGACTSIRAAILNAAIDNTIVDDLENIVGEIEELNPALDTIHQQLRTALMKVEIK